LRQVAIQIPGIFSNAGNLLSYCSIRIVWYGGNHSAMVQPSCEVCDLLKVQQSLTQRFQLINGESLDASKGAIGNFAHFTMQLPQNQGFFAGFFALLRALCFLLHSPLIANFFHTCDVRHLAFLLVSP
jgi:hypothetical protein